MPRWGLLVGVPAVYDRRLSAGQTAGPKAVLGSSCPVAVAAQGATPEEADADVVLDVVLRCYADVSFLDIRNPFHFAVTFPCELFHLVCLL